MRRARRARRTGLAGLSGTLGLQAVYQLARRIESEGDAGRLDTQDIAQLPPVLARTREALAEGAAAK